MAIQFTCPACSQPIEIDDQYAGQQVVCPYCEGVVTAPAESQPVATTQPAASPVPRPAPLSPGAAQSAPAIWPPPPPALTPNRPGNWSLAAGLLAWALFIAAVCYSAVVTFGLIPEETWTHAGAGPAATEEVQEQIQNAIQRFTHDPALAGKRSVATALQFVGAAFGLVGLILAVVGLTRKQARKGTAIAGLVISAPLLLCLLLSAMVGVAQTAGPAAAPA